MSSGGTHILLEAIMLGIVIAITKTSARQNTYNEVLL
jgi:cell division protein FtsW (lipid II flippase)